MEAEVRFRQPGRGALLLQVEKIRQRPNFMLDLLQPNQRVQSRQRFGQFLFLCFLVLFDSEIKIALNLIALAELFRLLLHGLHGLHTLRGR